MVTSFVSFWDAFGNCYCKSDGGRMAREKWIIDLSLSGGERKKKEIKKQN